MSRHRIVFLCLTPLLLLVGPALAQPPLTAAGSPDYIITADAGSMHKVGDQVAANFTGNVQAVNTQDHSTLTSGQLTADGTTKDITEAQASYNVKVSELVTMNGRPYRLNINAQRLTRESATAVLRFSGAVGKSRPVLTLVPQDSDNPEHLQLTADLFEYDQDAQVQADEQTGSQAITFIKALGSAVMTAVMPSEEKAGAVQHLYATAPVILGNYENAGGDAMAQVFRFDRNRTASQPHVEITGQNATADEDVTKLDADMIAYYPQDEKGDKAAATAPRILAMKADGGVKFYSIRHVVNKERATEVKGKGKKKKSSLFSFDLPTNQLWTVESGELTYWLEPKTDATESKNSSTFERAIWVTHKDGEGSPHTVLIDRNAPAGSPPVLDMNTDEYINLDTQAISDSPESASGGGN